jgi:hypothetical protein
VREQVAIAPVNKGVRLGALDRSEEELAVYDELVERFEVTDAERAEIRKVFCPLLTFPWVVSPR